MINLLEPTLQRITSEWKRSPAAPCKMVARSVRVQPVEASSSDDTVYLNGKKDTLLRHVAPKRHALCTLTPLFWLIRNTSHAFIKYMRQTVECQCEYMCD